MKIHHHLRMWRPIAAIALTSAVAACGSDPTGVTIDNERTFPDHRELDITFDNAGVSLSGTVYLPLGSGPFRAIVINGGSTWTTRDTWEQVGGAVLEFGAVFSYDRRGSGASGGDCCPPDEDAMFQLLAGDAAAAAKAIGALGQVDAGRVGLLGSSFSGWTVPIAATIAPNDIAWLIIVVGGAVSTGQEHRYDILTGYDVCQETGTPLQDITDQLIAEGPSGWDPEPSLEALNQPTLWLFGGRDLSHPTLLSIHYLNEITSRSQKPWTIHVSPNANHEGIEGGTICQATGPQADFLTPIRAFLGSIGG